MQSYMGQKNTVSIYTGKSKDAFLPFSLFLSFSHFFCLYSTVSYWDVNMSIIYPFDFIPLLFPLYSPFYLYAITKFVYRLKVKVF